MSSRSSRRKFTTEFKVEAGRRVFDSGRSIAVVARELSAGEQSLGVWVRDERRRMDAENGTENEPLTPQERAELATLCKKVAELEKNLLILGKMSAYAGDGDYGRREPVFRRRVSHCSVVG